MSDNAQRDPVEALAEAHATIQQQQRYIELLRQRLDESHALEALGDIYVHMATAKMIADPVIHHQLLEMIVETAARVVPAAAASLFLIDAQQRELVFEVAIGPAAANAKQQRVPLGHGVAGLVALSGQPLAISDAENNPLHASDISQTIGYTPHSILCVPLFYQDGVIGVLELLDKEGDEAFDGGDMELVGVFANQAAVAIELSRTHASLAALFAELMQHLTAEPQDRRQQLLEHVRAFSQRLGDDATVKQALDMAVLVQELVWFGDDERVLCQTILQGLVDYLHARPAPVHQWIEKRV